jgi:hypothetical protein
MLVTDEENNEEFAPNREIGDDLGVLDGDSSQSDEETPEEERHFDYTPMQAVHDHRQSWRARPSLSQGLGGGQSAGFQSRVQRSRTTEGRCFTPRGVHVFTNPRSSHWPIVIAA